MKNKRKKYIRAAILSAIIIILITAFDNRLAIKHYEVTSEKITSPVKIAFISDLHSENYGEGQHDLFYSIDGEKPDAVLLGGDIVDDKKPRDKAGEFLREVAKKYPTFYVSGNHEYWSHDIDGIKDMIRGYGITVLEGDSVRIEVRGQQLDIYGVDDPESGGGQLNKQLEKCAESLTGEAYSILIAHRPERIKTYAKYKFDMVLSGHAHGGQWRIPGIINGVYAPNQGWFPKYAGGHYKIENMDFIVSRGLAKSTGYVPRIYNRPEVVFITINNS